MAMENTTPHQDIGYQVVQVMARRIRPDTPRPIVLGGLPAGAIILGGFTRTIEPFEDGASLHVGTADKPDSYGSLSLGAKGRGAFADNAEAVTSPIEIVINSPEDEKKEAPAPAQAKAEPANEKEAKARAARAAEAKEAKTKKPEAEPEETKPPKGEAVVYLTFIVVR